MADHDEALDTRTRTALFRHSLVATLVDLDPGELRLELKRLATRTHEHPSGRRARVGKSTLRRWLKALRAGGFTALMPALRSDYGASRAVPEDWIKKAISLRREGPHRTARVLVEMLGRLAGCPPINPHTLDTILRRRGWTRNQAGKKPKKRRQRWAAAHVNDLWQGDATPGLWLPDPRWPRKNLQSHLFLWLDDVSRLVPHAEFFFDQKLPRMERTLKLALCRRGVPGRLYTDNGNVYRAEQFAAALAELGIHPRYSEPYSPEGRGKIERIFGVIQNDFYPEAILAIKAGHIKTLGHLNECLWAWLECVYHQRIHSELERRPIEVFREGLNHVKPADPQAVYRAFLWRYIRTVSRNGFISLLGNSYSVDPSWSGQKLELRLDPFDLSHVDVYRDRRPVARAQVRELKQARLLDLEPLVVPPPDVPSGVNFLEMLRQEHREQLKREIGPVPFARAINEEEA